MNRLDEALAASKELFENSRGAQLDALLAGSMASDYGRILFKMKRFEEAGPALSEAIARMESLEQTAHPRYLTTMKQMIQVSDELKRPTDAKMWQDRVAAYVASHPPATTSTTRP